MPSKRATPTKPRQRTIAAHLSEESYDALVAFTDVNGTTIAALLEAIGRRLRIPSNERRDEVPEWLVVLLEDSRRIAAERRRRR
jgi:hypothetical protein